MDTDADIIAAGKAGRDCGLNGPNTTNCHYRHFATPRLTAAWESGKRVGERDKEQLKS